ncbi:MAG: glycosyltransferase [Patescibacteria group bacterium]
MKIAVLNSLYSPYNRGGAERVTETIVAGLKNLNHDVFVITNGPWRGRQSLKPQIEVVNEIKVYRFYPLNLFSFININRQPKWLRYPWHLIDIFNWHSYFVIKEILRNEQPDLVLGHNLKGLGYLIPLAIKKSGIKKYFQTVHDVQLAVPSGLLIKGDEKRADSWLNKIYQLVCRRLFNSVSVIISPSKWLLDFYQQREFFTKAKKIVLTNPLPNLPAVIIRPPKQGSGWRLLYVGQIQKAKGIIFLIETLKGLGSADGKDWQLDIVGDGTALDEVKELTRNNPRFKISGWVNHQGLADKLLGADFLVVPSLCYENSPRVISESLSYGLPVIGAAIGGIGEMIQDGVNGFLFTAGDSGDLQKVISSASQQPLNLEPKTDLGLGKYLESIFGLI